MASKHSGQFTTIWFLAGSSQSAVPGPVMKAFTNKLKNFEAYFQAQVFAVTENLAKSGENITKKTIREAKTQWGVSRMSGNHYGVKFQAYGRSAGREDSGHMYDSVSSETTIRNGVAVGTYGWQPSVYEPYFAMQAFGFESTGRFSPGATRASGQAKFSEDNEPVFIPGFGFGSQVGAGPSIRKRMKSAYSAAWNEAVRQYEKNGLKGNPGTYMQQAKSKPNRWTQ